MERKLIALKRILDELGIQSAIESVDDRKRVQKAVYLAQLPGVNLGYRFSWYLKGPYSPDLTKDYYSLAEALSNGEDRTSDKQLNPNVRNRLSKIRALMSPPKQVDLKQPDWLELVASVHYLRKIACLDTGQAESRLLYEKPHLSDYLAAAEEALKQSSLLPA